MRELQLEGFVPVVSNGTEVEVIYKGPFREVRDDDGLLYQRGRRVAVPAMTAARLRASEMTNQFTVFEPQATRPELLTACGN